MKKRFSAMKRTLSLVMALAMALTMLPAAVFAAGETKSIYLNAGGSSLWDQAGAWFDAWVWGSSSEADAWYTFTDYDFDGVYEIKVPADAAGMKILRKDPASTEHNWNSWNATGDLSIGSSNCYTITGWGGSDGSWSSFTAPDSAALTVVGMASLCGSEWDLNASANNMAEVAENVYEKVFTNVAKGTHEFKIAANHSWTLSWGKGSGNASVAVEKEGSTVTVTFDAATKTITTSVKAVYSVSFNGSNVTSSGASSVAEGSAYSATLEAAEGYALPESITVTADGSEVEHSYDSTTGKLTIDAAKITGDIVITAEAVKTAPDTITLYFRNDWKWTDVSVYYWGSSGTNPSWYGIPMTFVETGSDGNDIYSAEVPADIAGFIFNGLKDDGSGNRDQSPDLSGAKDGDAYYMHWDGANKCSKFDYTPSSGEDEEDDTITLYFRNDWKWTDVSVYYWGSSGTNPGWHGIPMTFVETGSDGNDIYSAEVPADITGFIFNGLKDDGSGNRDQSPDLSGAKDGDAYYMHWDGENKCSKFEYTPSSGENTNVTYEAVFHFANTLGWGTVNLYTWIDDVYPTGSWPGSKAALDADGFYTITATYEAAAGKGLNFIFNNGSAQTVDLSLAASEFVDNKAEKWVVLTTQTDGKYNADIFSSADAIAVSPVVNGTSVTFRYKDAAASDVVVMSSINDWASGYTMTKNSYGIWSVTLNNVKAGIHQYKFKIGDQWVTDPLNSWVVDGNSAFLISDPSKDTNTVTVNVHYVRADNNYENWNVYTWNSDMTKQYDLTVGTNEAVAKIVLAGRATQDLNFKLRKSVGANLWAAEEAQVTVDLSTIVSGTIDVYVTAGNASATIALSDDVVYANKVASVEYDYDKNTITIETGAAVADPSTAFDVINTKDADDSITMTADASSSGTKYVFTLSKEMDLKTLYQYKILFTEQEKFKDTQYDIGMSTAYASDKFASEFTYTGDDLGADWSEGSTTFKVWAPTAESVSVKLYRSGTAGTDDLIKSVAMKNDNSGNKGEWTVTVEGDLSGVYYTYEVLVDGETVEAVDPYARTAGVNGNRGMVIDLGSTDPDGWASDTNPNPVTSYTDAVIYELHVRDFSIDKSSGVKDEWRGKFMALTETGTTSNDGTTPTGLDHMKDLGITHLHLLPIYDYASVDETKCENFNWGYDPLNYNVPEGSYSTDPYKGEVRVSEMKQMVSALHDNGISVVMDVVYNHVYDAETFCFNKIVPGYFSRVNSNTSGCGNDTASEREMVSKYIVDSVLYWTEEYHIDGFRFDLVGLIDIDTINKIVEEVHKVRPDVIFYGEGWDMDGTNKEPGTEMAKQGNASKTKGFAYFSDNMRNLLAGNNGKSLGFVSGSGGEGELVGNYMANPWWTSNPSQVVQYASCHDNYTLVDKLIISTKKNGLDSDIVKMNNLAAAIYMTSQGIPFIHAGEEFLREKLEADGGRCENSYNAPDSVNHIAWSNLENKLYSDNAAYYKGLIAFRKAHPALSLSTAAEVKAAVFNQQASDKLVSFWIDCSEVEGETVDSIYTIFNANTGAKTVTLPAGKWDVYVNGTKAGTEVLETVEDSVSVAGISAMVLVQKESTEEPEAKSDVALPGSFNNWNQAEFMDFGEAENTVTKTISLPAKDYEFKIKVGDTWLGNTGTINDTTGSNGWEMSESVQSNCKLKATGGAYTFTFDTVTRKLTVTHDPNGGDFGNPDEYFLYGYINGADYAMGIEAGDYKFDEAGKLTATFTQDSYVCVRNGDASEKYMTKGWLGNVTNATMHDVANLSDLSGYDKLMVPGGMEVTFTLVVNDNGTVNLSYAIAADDAVEDTSGIQNGVTLHCWNWSFAEIEANIADIAAKGYTAIQTSPVQPLKEATNLSTNSVGTHWWVYYQPVDFEITDQSGNALGTKDDLLSMIETAHQYGIKVIIDVVSNHLGNETGNDLSSAIPEYLLNEDYWHDIKTNTSDYTDREDITQHCMSGLPDLNTGNDDIQGYVLDFLKECIDAGADGFRFDAVKHIETPDDAANFASDFWPTVIGGAEEYAEETYGKDVYMYGELLDSPGDGLPVSAYTKYMAITDNAWGNSLRGSIAADQTALSSGYNKAADASALVIWAESHDTYATDVEAQSSLNVSEEDINKTWALVAARADAMPLYLARPADMDQALGVASVTGWANDEVEAVNEFHNAFVGEDEVLSNENGVSYVERGTTGAVLVNVSASSSARAAAVSVSVTAKAMQEGTYVDQITGSIFTVANGKISGEIGSAGIAVIYNPAAAETHSVTVSCGEGGSASVDNETPETGDEVTVTVAANTGKELDSITVKGADEKEVALTDNGDGTYTFDQPACDVTVTVSFKAVAYQITVSGAAGGKVSVDKETSAAGEEVTITAAPDAGKQVGKVTVTDMQDNEIPVTENLDGTYRFEQPAGNVTVKVTFENALPEEETYRVRVRIPLGGGTVNVSSRRPSGGDTVVIYPEAEPGMILKNLTVTDEFGDPVKVKKHSNGVYTFDQPNCDVLVEVIFEEVALVKPPVTGDRTAPLGIALVGIALLAAAAAAAEKRRRYTK